MFPQVQDVDLSLHRNPPQFPTQSTELPVVLLKVLDDGVGDLMMTVKLAQGLAPYFRRRETVMYVTEGKDWAIVKNLFPERRVRDDDFDLGNIHVRKVSLSSLEEKLIHQDVAVFSPVVSCASAIPSSRFFRGAHINVYVREEDGYNHSEPHSIINPLKPVRDDRGRLHYLVETGFDEASTGIHLDGNLIAAKDEDFLSRREVLRRFGVEDDELAERLAARKWAFSYQQHPEIVHSFKTALGDIADSEEIPYLLLNFDRGMCQGDVREMATPDLERGVIEYAAPSASHEVFLACMYHADAPLLVTGDASLSEAISLNRSFVPEYLDWKPQRHRFMAAFAHREVDSALVPYPIEDELLVPGLRTNTVIRLLSELSRQPSPNPFFDAFNRAAHAQLNLYRNLATNIHEALDSQSKGQERIIQSA